MRTRQLDKPTLPQPSEHFIALPLLALGVLLVISGAFALDLAQIAVGVIASIAGLRLERREGAR